jgi:hypothetical protein
MCIQSGTYFKIPSVTMSVRLSVRPSVQEVFPNCSISNLGLNRKTKITNNIEDIIHFENFGVYLVREGLNYSLVY